MKWLVLGAAVVAVAVPAVRRRLLAALRPAAGDGFATHGRSVDDRSPRRPAREDDLTRIVLDAFSSDWAQRLEVSESELRSRLQAPGAAPGERIVDLVELEFSRTPKPGNVAATLRCSYAGRTGNAVAEMDLPWERLPPDVRSEFLRTGVDRISRHWTDGS